MCASALPAASGPRERSKSIQDYQGLVYGGAPGAAALGFGRFIDDRGVSWPAARSLDSFSGMNRSFDVQVDAKWEPTVQGTLSGFFEYLESKSSSLQTVNPLVFASNPAVASPIKGIIHGNDTLRTQVYELSYYYRFNPQAAFLAYYAYRAFPAHSIQNTLFSNGFTEQDYFSHTFDFESHNIQLQQHLQASFWGQHNFTAGFDYFTIPSVSQRIDFSIPPHMVQNFDLKSPHWNYSFYLLDYWRPVKNLVLELCLFKDFYKSVRELYLPQINTNLWSPSFGANYQFRVNSTQHVLRGVVGRWLNTHFTSQPLLLPSQTAGFPWTIDSLSGSEIRQAGFAWEAQWDTRTFTVLRLNALRVSTPTFFTDVFTLDHPIWQTWKRYQASLILNRILTTSFGLSAGILGKRVIPDLSYEFNWPDSLRSFSEIDAFIGLAYLHPRGWLARVRPFLVQQYGQVPGHQANNPFVIVNLTLGREFPNKQGFALVEIQNLFNRRPFYSLEPSRDLDFANQRRFLCRLGFYF